MQVLSRFTTAAGLLAVVAAGLTLAIPACDKQSSCRPGTLFLQVDLGPFVSGASELDVGVSVDGAIVMHTSLAVKPGMQTGGIEVQFPQGYPAGKAVMIQVAVKAGGTETALHTLTVFPGSGCEVVDAVFSGSDAITGAAGAGGGSGGIGGEAGTLGSVPGTGGPAGMGGATGGSIGGTFAGGRGGAGGTGGGGTGGACVVVGPENCFNGADDDCDGLTDCADSECQSVAQCVPNEGSGARVGVLVAMTATCPTGFDDAFTLMSGLSATDCTGCSCRPPIVTCSTTVYSFGSASACSGTTDGTQELTFSSTQTCTVPSWTGGTQGTIYGVRTTAFAVSPGNCVPAGTPTPGPVNWMNTVRFCAARNIGGGCFGGACAPVTSLPVCTMYDGVHVCQGSTTTSYWNTGASDTRACSGCTCGAPTGANCSGLTLNVGSDFSCAMVTLSVGQSQRKCTSASGVNSPGLIFSGSPTAPTCAASSTVMGGSVTAIGQKTVCCM